MTQERTPSDIVAALLFLTGQEFILSNSLRLHRALYAAREVSPLIDCLGFSLTGANPTSRVFNEALSNLKLSRVVRMENTDYDRYILDADARRYIENEILSRFTTEEIKGLRLAALIIARDCGTESSQVASA